VTVSMREFGVRDSAWHLYASVLFNGLVMALICSGELDAVNLWIRALIYLNAFVLSLGGLYLIFKEPFRKALLDEPTIESKSICLDAFHLMATLSKLTSGKRTTVADNFDCAHILR
jgi:hypothetical protein